MSSTRRIHHRALVTATAAALALAGAAATATAAEPATLRLMGSSPTYGSAVDVTLVGGRTIRVRPARYNYRIAHGGRVDLLNGFCVDTSHYFTTGRDYDVSLQTAADAPEMASGDYREAGWLVSQADRLITEASDAPREAGAIQIAVWQLTGQAADVPSPTSDPGLNARVAQLRTIAEGMRVPEALDVSVTGPSTCAGEAATVTVTGTPGAVVDLEASPPTAAVTPARVVIDATGTATATLTSPGAGDVTLHASADAPVPVRATKLPGAANPQDQLLVLPGELTDEVTQPFVDCGVYLLGTPPAVTGPFPAPPPADPPAAEPAPASALGLDVGAPPVTSPGGTVAYRIRVSNDGTRPARGVVVRQALGPGLRPLTARGPAGSTRALGRRAVTWRIPRILPGRAVTLTSTVRVGRGLMGDIGRTGVTVRDAHHVLRAGAVTAVVRPVTPADQGF